jgi:hypothetical protein
VKRTYLRLVCQRGLECAAVIPLLCAPCLPVLAMAKSPRARDATVKGYVRLCGGPAPGRCYINTIGFCEAPKGCVTSDRVAVLDARGRRVAEQRLHHARFNMRLPPGSYTVELLGDGKRARGHIMQRKEIIAREDRTAIVVFFFAIP